MEKIQQNDIKINETRKTEHLEIALNDPVQFRDISTGFENYYFLHQALPAVNLLEIDLSTVLFGKRLLAPILVSSMVGGISQTSVINLNLAKAAQKLGLAMGVGSQRVLKDSPGLVKTFYIRDVAPDILLFANLGAVQLNYGFGVKECLSVVKSIEADGLILHLNPLQEALQTEGNTNFYGLLEKIKQLCQEMPVPVIVKEVGNGISEATARKLVQTGVAAIDVAGSGGTCWSEIERRRLKNHLGRRIAANFSSWGIPTAESLAMTRKAAPLIPVIASGGIRTGIDIAKAIALGADACGIGLPLLKQAINSTEEAQVILKEVIEVLRVTMFCAGSGNINQLKYSGSLKKR
jgi:isopentenyl-diphosphate Delta-isomerase